MAFVGGCPRHGSPLWAFATRSEVSRDLETTRGQRQGQTSDPWAEISIGRMGIRSTSQGRTLSLTGHVWTSDCLPSPDLQGGCSSWPQSRSKQYQGKKEANNQTNHKECSSPLLHA